jgi:hypothetical protein
VSLWPSFVFGQSALEKFERQIKQSRVESMRQDDAVMPVEQRALIDYGGYLSLGYFSIDDRVGENHVLRQYELLGYGRVNLDGAHEIFARARIGWRDFHSGDSFDGRGDEPIDGDLDRGYYRFDLQRAIAASRGETIIYDLVIQAGRDLAYWANGLVLAQTIDGVIGSFTWEDLDIDFVGGVTPTRTVDFDSSRPAFDHTTRRGFYGAMMSYQVGPHRPYVYGLWQSDDNKDDFARIAGVDTSFHYDSWYIGFGSAGALSDRMLYGVEIVYEGGRGLASSVDRAGNPIAQSEEDIAAFAADLRFDYLLPDPRHTRFTLELLLASGDEERLHGSNTFGGNQPGSDDHSFNAFGAINTGLAFAPAVSNLAMVRLGASTVPFTTGEPWKRIQAGADLLAYWKLRADAAIDEPTSGDHYLGFEPDLFLNWQVTNDVTLAVRYGVFFPGSAIAGDGSPRQFFFFGVTYAF